MKMKRAMVLGFALFVVVFGINWYFFAHSHSVNDAEDRQRWLREVDEDNERQGLIKDTNGDWIFVGVTNSKVISN